MKGYPEDGSDSEVYKWLSVSLNTNEIYETRRTTDENNAYD